MKRLIVCADDFGLSWEVNEAVEIAHRRGVLTCASLMVAGPAAGDAVRRLRTNPCLKVGLHLALADAVALQPAVEMRGLCDEAGRLDSRLWRQGLLLAASRGARRRMRAEIEAQFRAFAATGLTLDHVNAHRHFHVHPLVATMILDIGPRYGMKALRAPIEPAPLIRAAEPGAAAARPLERIFAARLRERALAAGVWVNSGVVGLRWSGAMTKRRWLAVLPNLPHGAWEIFCHPATANTFPGSAPGSLYAEELEALTDAQVMDAIARTGAARSGYDDARAHMTFRNSRFPLPF